MKENKWIIPLLILSLAGGVIFYLISGIQNKKKHNWNRTLRMEKYEPYDLSVFYETLKESLGDSLYEVLPGSQSIREMKKLAEKDSHFNYFYVGRKNYMTGAECDTLLDHVSRGATAFISSGSIPPELAERIPGLNKLRESTFEKDSVTGYFFHPELHRIRPVFRNQYKDTVRPAEWNYFTLSAEWDESEDSAVSEGVAFATVSALDSVYSDCVLMYYGKGSVYVHINPVIFSNLYMQSEGGRLYVQALLRHMPRRMTLFDRTLSVPHSGSRSGGQGKNIFDFISENKSLEYAWWILITGLGLFLLTGGKRFRRSIPVIAPPENNALQVVQAIGEIYFSEKDYALVFRRQWNQFLSFLRMNFRLAFEEDSPEIRKKISEKTGVSPDTIDLIFTMREKYGTYSRLKKEELLETNRCISQFYHEYYHKNGKQ